MDADHGAATAILAWNQAVEALTRQLNQSIDRLNAPADRSPKGVAFAYLREAERWIALAEHMAALSPPPAAENAHKRMQDCFDTVARAGRQIREAGRTGNPERRAHVVDLRLARQVQPLNARLRAAESHPTAPAC